MDGSTTPTGELETLSKIVNEIKPTGDLLDQLDQFSAKVNEVIPFKKCVLLHERDGKSISRGIIYRSNGRPSEREEGSRGRSWIGPPIGISRYLACFEKSEALDNAFFWRDTGTMDGDFDPRVAELRNQMKGGEGVAGSVRSLSSDTGDVATLFQLECTRGTLRMRHLLMVSFIAFYLHSSFTLRVVDSTWQDEPSGVNLTAKEKEVLKWVIEGKTSWEVGRILSMSERTVKFHLKNVYTKLNVSNRAQAVTVASRLRLI